MLKREYLCPKCRKTISFISLARKRSCPHCGSEVMDWDLKQAVETIKAKLNWVAVVVALLGVGAVIASFLFFSR